MLRNNCPVCLGLIYKKQKKERKKNLFSLTINKPDVFVFLKKIMLILKWKHAWKLFTQGTIQQDKYFTCPVKWIVPIYHHFAQLFMGLVHQAILAWWSSHLASIFPNPTISQQQKSAFPLHCSFALSISKLQIVHSSFCGIHPSISTTSGHPSYLLVSLLFLICCKEKAISTVSIRYCCTETQDFLTYKKHFYLCWVVQIFMSCYIFSKARNIWQKKFQSKEKQKGAWNIRANAQQCS